MMRWSTVTARTQITCVPTFFFAVNPCCSFPCQNDGVCVADGDSYSCDCTRTGYYGVNCETREYSTECTRWWVCFDVVFSFPAAHWGTWVKSLIKPSQDTLHYLLTHFSWVWWIVNNVEFIQNPIMRAVYFCKLCAQDAAEAPPRASN